MGRSVKHAKGTSAYTVQVKRISKGGPTQLLHLFSGMIRGSPDFVGFAFSSTFNHMEPKEGGGRQDWSMRYRCTRIKGYVYCRRDMLPLRTLTAKPDQTMFPSTGPQFVVSRRSMIIIAVQGKAISRAGMMKALSDFVGADMSDVDRYVLKQGSTMVGKSTTCCMV